MARGFRRNSLDVGRLVVNSSHSCLIFGPGEAKGELKRRLEGNKLGGRAVAVDAADRMTDRQIAPRVWIVPRALPLLIRAGLVPRLQRRLFFGVPLPPLDPAFSFRA